MRAYGKKGRAEPPAELTRRQREALLAYAAYHGRNWKAELAGDWTRAAANVGGEYRAELQQIRNTLGPAWLKKVTLAEIQSAAPGATESLEDAILEHARDPVGTLRPGMKFGDMTITQVGTHTVVYQRPGGWRGSVQIPFLDPVSGVELPSHRRALAEFGMEKNAADPRRPVQEEVPGTTPIANASEVDFFEDNTFVREGPLWLFSFGAYGATHVYVWADGMESGFETAVEWLDDNAPGLLVMVDENDYRRAAEDLGKVWDPSEPDDEIMQAAEADMTMIGHTTLQHGNAVASWEWHVREVKKGSPEWNQVVERSREESGEFEENASKSQSVVLAALRGKSAKAGAFHTVGGIVYSYNLPIADLRNPEGPFYVLDKIDSPSVTTSKHIGFVRTWLAHIKSWLPIETVSAIG